MPEIKLQKIISVSSEDKRYPVSNLLGSAGSGKWRCGTAGEKKVSVIIQLQNPSKISGIHVGNEASAFVEVLVGKESTSTDGDWKVCFNAYLMAVSAARQYKMTSNLTLRSYWLHLH